MHKCRIYSQTINTKVVLLHEHKLRTFTLFVCSVIGDALVKAMPAMQQYRSLHVVSFSSEDPLLIVYANVVVHWVEIWVLELQVSSNKRGCFKFRKSQM